MIHLCANCGKFLIENENGLHHQNAYKKCKHPQIKDLIGVHFTDGYFEFRVVKKHRNDGQYYCDGVAPNKKKGRVYDQEIIVANSLA